MLMLDFFKYLAESYKELNPTVSMCYHGHDNEFFIDGILEGHSMSLHKAYGQEIGNKTTVNYDEAFEELFLERTSYKVKCIHLQGMYFIPSNCDEGIIFAKNLQVLLKNKWMIKNVEYELITLP